MESTKFMERCKKHPNYDVEFMKINNSESSQSIPFFSCLYCLTSESIFDFKDYLPIKCIIQNGLDEINKQWPPVNSPDLLDKLWKVMYQNTTTEKLVQTVIQFFADFKKSINDSIDTCQKKMVKIAEEIPCTAQNILKKYQEISKIDELRSHLLNNNIDQDKKENLCSELIKLQSQQSQNNTDILKSLLSQNIQKLTLNLEKPLMIQQSILESIDSINLFQKLNQNIDVDLLIGNLNNGQNDLKLSHNTNNQPVVEVIKLSINDWKNVVSSIILDQNTNYVFKLKLDIQQNGYNLFVGLMQDQYFHTQRGLDEYFCCYFTKKKSQISQDNRGYGINVVLKGDKCILSEQNEIEVRVNINEKILHILDYPNYNWKLGLSDQYQNQLNNNSQYRLYLGMDYLSKVTLIESRIVGTFD